ETITSLRASLEKSNNICKQQKLQIEKLKKEIISTTKKNDKLNSKLQSKMKTAESATQWQTDDLQKDNSKQIQEENKDEQSVQPTPRQTPKMLYIAASNGYGISAAINSQSNQKIVATGNVHGGATIEFINSTIPETVCRMKPDTVVVQCGTNNITVENTTTTISKMKSLITTLKTTSNTNKTKTAVVEIPYRRDKPASHKLNTKIDAINSATQSECKKQDIHFIRINTTDYNKSILGRQGLHFNVKGRQHVARNVLKTLYPNDVTRNFNDTNIPKHCSNNSNTNQMDSLDPIWINRNVVQ
ncbi:unnamed protein product, partial [Owenia fusiformis]